MLVLVLVVVVVVAVVVVVVVEIETVMVRLHHTFSVGCTFNSHLLHYNNY